VQGTQEQAARRDGPQSSTALRRRYLLFNTLGREVMHVHPRRFAQLLSAHEVPEARAFVAQLHAWAEQVVEALGT